MIADFGLSKELKKSVDPISDSKLYGIPAYIEPQCFLQSGYKRDKRSDIYSLGVLLWEITSGYSPFRDTRSCEFIQLSFQISNGRREDPIDNTPSDYINLYQKCWDGNPELRPTIDNVYDILEKMFSGDPEFREYPNNKPNLNLLNPSHLQPHLHSQSQLQSQSQPQPQSKNDQLFISRLEEQISK
jgi:serine/threonine protein kinase